jgi:molecular chaperone GrpE
MSQRTDPAREPAAADETAGAPVAPNQPADVQVGADQREERAVEADIESLQEALSNGENRYLRLAADFENFRRRKEQELVDSRRYASEEAAITLLPVLDNLRRAVEHAPGGEEDFFVNGLHLVVREFEAALQRIGVSPVPGAGEPFDPAVHEAVSGEEGDVDRDTVAEVLLPGYRLHDRLLRPSVVRVRHPRAPEAAG